MATTVARVEIDADVDGSGIPRQVRNIARKAGEEGGAEFDKSFNKGMSKAFDNAMANTEARFSSNEWDKTFTKAGDKNGTSWGRAFEKMAQTSLGQSVGRLGKTLRTLRGDADDTAGGFGRLRNAVKDTGFHFGNTSPMLRFRLAMMKIREMFSGFGGDSDKVKKSLDSQGGGWSSLSHNTKQWTLIIGAVAAAMPQLAVLSSALGGTIVALGTAFVGAAVGAGLLGVAFFGLADDTIKLNAGAQASKDAFGALGDAFKELQGGITNAVFENMADSISNITNTLLPGIQDAILSFASSAGEGLGRIFDALSSPAAIETFNQLLAGFEPIFDSVIDLAISLGDALGNIFVLALPLAQEFMAAIAGVVGQFAAWTGTPEGAARITEWFDTARIIMPEVMELVGAVGTAISNLVTPQSIEMTKGLLDSLTEFMPALSGILAALGGINVFGVLAELLNQIGQALMPLMPALQNFGTAVGTLLMGAIVAITPLLQTLGTALQPIFTAFTNLLTVVGPPLFTAFEALTGALAPLIEGVGTLAGALIGALAPVLGVVFTALSQIFSAVAPLVAQLVGALMPVLLQIVDAFTQVFAAIVPLITQLIAALMPAIMVVIEAFMPLIDVILEVVATVIPPLVEIITLLIDTIMPLMPIIAQVAMLIGQVLATAISILMPIVNILISIIRILFAVLTPIITVIIGVVKVIVDFITQTGILQAVIKVLTDVVREFGNFFRDVFRGISDAISGVVNWFNDLVGTIKGAADAVGNFLGGAGGAVADFLGFANGGIITGPTRALMGEAGPEAIVPLNRPLGQVDPQVRWLSAIAQGKPSMASGGIVGGGRAVTIAPGAVQVFDSGNARQTAYNVLDVLANRIAG